MQLASSLVVALLALILVACSSSPSAPTDIPKPATTMTVTPPPAAVPPAKLFPTSGRVQAKVVRVIDGDTIEVEIDGKRYTVRYVGVHTPETPQKRPSEPYGREATAKNRELVYGKTVTLEKDVSETDPNDRLLRYVYVDSTFVNAELVRQGYAQVAAYPPDVKYADQFRQLEREARDNNLGLWGLQVTPQATAMPPTATQPPVLPTATMRRATPTLAPAVPTAARPPATATPRPAAPTATTAPARGNCDPSYPDVCIPPYPPDLNCKDIPYRRFRVLPPDPHQFDGNKNGIGCE